MPFCGVFCHSFHIVILIHVISLCQFLLWEQLFLRWFLSDAQAARQRILDFILHQMLTLRLWKQSKDHWHEVPLNFIRRQPFNSCNLFCNFLFHINVAEAKHRNAGLLNYSLNFSVQPYAAEQNLINLFCQNTRKLKPQQSCSQTPTENMELTWYHPHWDIGPYFKWQIM